VGAGGYASRESHYIRRRIMSDTLPSEIDSATSIPDIREQTLGDVAPAALSILRRVLKKTGATVPVAAFQSSI